MKIKATKQRSNKDYIRECSSVHLNKYVFERSFTPKPSSDTRNRKNSHKENAEPLTWEKLADKVHF